MATQAAEIISSGYEPREHQAQVHLDLKRFNVLVCHRRFGKTVLGINELVDCAMECQLERPRFAYIAPLYKQAKQVAWDYLKAYTPFAEAVYESELRVDLPGDRRIQLFGADNPDALRGIYLDGVVVDEYGQMRPVVWTQILRPALADRLGWAIFAGTPKGKNAFADLYEAAVADPDWYAAMFKASETGIVNASELQAARRDMSDEEYEQEFECSFTAAIVGAYYAKELAKADADGRIKAVPYDPSVPVHTAWDLGIGDSNAIWFLQRVANEVHWIDYLENSGQGLDWYVRELQAKPYVYGTHLLPHDAEARELGTGKTRVETLATLGMKVKVVPIHRVDDGIHAVRQWLPLSWFDAQKCERGLEALRNYRREWDEKNGIFRSHPLHDWASHGADAARTAAMGNPQNTSGIGPKVIKYDNRGIR